MKHLATTCAVVFGMWLASIASAQQSALPAVGSALPSVTVFDESGQPFSTDQLRGEYAVIVFGCLT